MTMADMLLDVVNYLKDNDVVEDDGKDCFRDYTPDSPDQVVVLTEYGGLPFPPHMVGALRRFQVIARSSRDDPDWGRRKAWELYNTLDVPEKIIDARDEDGKGMWGVITALQTPHKMRVDDNGRDVYGFNVAITTERDRKEE